MSSDPPRGAGDLRLRAEGRLATRSSEPGEAPSDATMARALHELQVHQIELELQNEELRVSRGDLEAAAARYTDLYDFAPVGYFSLDREGTIRQANLEGARLLGLERARLPGKRLAGFIAPTDQPAFRAFLAQVFAGQSYPICDVELPRAGEAPWLVQIEATLSLDEQECRAVAVDITERAALEAQVRGSQKMEAIGTLTGGIAHEFNNVLAAMVGYAELAMLDAEPLPAVLDSLHEITKAGARATDLVQQLLTFSRHPEEHRGRPIQLGPVVDEALRLLRAAVPASVTFHASLPADLDAVLFSAAQVHQVIMNLGTNAAHAMRGRAGRLELTLANCVVDASVAGAPRHLRPGPYVRLTVTDTGHGMDRATVERVFDPFFSTKLAGEGAGLGLSVVHGIMRRHKGAVTVRSRPGEGTTFDLYFPAAGRVAPEQASGVTAVPRGRGERILVVDDEEALCRIGKRVLESQGYVVDVETQPRAALEAVRARPDAYALVVTDLHMPDLLGTELARQLLAIKPGLPILLLSGNAADLTDGSVQALGLRGLLSKPVSMADLGHAVHRALAG